MPTTVVHTSLQVQGQRRARYLPFFFAVLSILITAGRGNAASVSVATSLTASQNQQFTAAVTGATNAGVTWSLSPALGTISGTGLYIAPASIASAQNVTVKAISTADPTQSASSTISLIPVTILLTPSTTSVTASQTQQFTATVTGTANTGVMWSLSPAVGTISSSGVYTAPASIASAQNVTVTATSMADPTKSASSTSSLIPVMISVTPSTTALTASQTQQFAATVTGTANTGVTWSVSPAVGTISAAGLYTAPATIAAAQTVTVKTTSVADLTKSASATVTLNPPVNVTVAPASVTLTQSQTQTFSATVTNTSNTAVTWSISPVVGSITAAGLYTAPASITSSQTVTVKATSVADPTKSATATVTLTPPVTVSLTPSLASLQPSQNQTFTATVSGTSNTGVTWSLNPALGSFVSGATTLVYVAPSTAPTTQTVTITVTSVANPSKIATAVITLLQAVTVSLSPSTVSLAPSGTQQFTTTVLGTSNTAVTWSITPSIGTISSAGLYTAPSSIPTSQTVTVTAQSVADLTKSASGVVSLQPTPVVNQWSIGYYSVLYGSPLLPISDIQWNGLTHIAHMAALVNSDGTLDITTHQTDYYATALVSAAHANNVKALLVVFASTPSNANTAVGNHLSAFVANIMSIVTTYGYDGVDIDWEPSNGFVNDSTSAANMATLAAALRTALGTKLLTAAALNLDSAFWNTVQSSLDRINVMTYDLGSGCSPYMWYNSALDDQDGRVWSLNLAKTRYLTAGIPAAKLGLGLAFYGYQKNGGVLTADRTQGISGPRQVCQTAPTATALNYNAIVPLITGQNYNWDPLAVVPYLSHIGTAPSTYWWLSYDNPQSIAAKVQYIIARNLGGWIIWHLGGDWITGTAHPHPLLDAVQAGSAPAVLSASALGSGAVGAVYSTSLSATGAGPRQWSLSSDSLPRGLSLNSTGLISGTPTTAGTSTFVVTVQNFAGSASQSFTITIAASAN